MKFRVVRKVLFVFLLAAIYACKFGEPKDENETEQKVEFVNYEALKPRLEKVDDFIYIVNFWATWCAPCVKELPYFERINKEYGSKNVKVLLVSLDFPKQVEKKLIPFLEKHKIESEVILLDDANEDYWIQAIDEQWSGALPATLIYNRNERKFYEQSFDYAQLENELLHFIN